MTKYNVTITGLGAMAIELMESGTMIIFDENAPEELSEISVLHTSSRLEKDVKPGDTLSIGEYSYKILDIGSEANHTLKSMGHCSLKFEGSKVQLPGEIVLEGDMPIVKVGDDIIIKRNKEITKN